MRFSRLIIATLALLVPAGAWAQCAGDCDGDGLVHVAELLRGIPCVILGPACINCCEDCHHDVDQNGVVSINELIAAVNNALNGCPATFRLYVKVRGTNRHLRTGWVKLLPPDRYYDRQDVDQGWFRFDDVPPGDYTLTYSYSSSRDELVLCSPFGCWPKHNPVSIVDADVSTTIPSHVPCRTSDDCSQSGGEQCVEPGGFVGCGVCQDLEDECAVDADCDGGSGRICTAQGRPPCPCDGTPALVCADACFGDADCRAGERCAEDGHCRPQACTVDDECPPLFACADDEGNPATTCSRRRCAADANCGEGGFCVRSRCYDELGACRAIPP